MCNSEKCISLKCVSDGYNEHRFPLTLAMTFTVSYLKEYSYTNFTSTGKRLIKGEENACRNGFHMHS